MNRLKIGKRRLLYFTIIVVIGLLIASKLIYNELSSSIALNNKAKVVLKVLSNLEQINNSFTIIIRNEKPGFIAHHPQSIIRIRENYSKAQILIDSLKDLQYQPVITGTELDSMNMFFSKHFRMPDSLVQKSLNQEIDKAIKQYDVLKDSARVHDFNEIYNALFLRLRNSIILQQQQHLNETQKIYLILWVVIIAVFALLFFAIINLDRQVKIKDELLFKNQTFSDIINYSSDAIVIIDLDFKIRFCNKATEDIFECNFSEIEDKDIDTQFQTIESRAEHIERRRQIQRLGFWIGELKLKSKKGELLEFHVTLNSLNGHEDIKDGYFIILSNITKLAKAQNEIKALAQSLTNVNHHLNDQVQIQTDLIKNVFERVKEVFVGTDSEFNINYVSQHIESIFGINIETLKGKQIDLLLSEIAGYDSIDYAKRSFFSGVTSSFEFKHFASGYWFEANIYPSQNGISIHFKDITENIKAEIEIIKSQKMYEFISRANENILISKNIDELFQNVCDVAVSFDDILFCWIGAPNKIDNKFSAIKWAGLEDGYFSAITAISSEDEPEGRGPTGKAFREGKYYYANDIEHDDMMKIWKDEALKRGFRSSITLPIKLENNVKYVFALYTSKANYFNDDQIGLLENIAENISYALQSFRIADLKRASELQLLKVLKAIEHSSASIVISDLKGDIEYVNPAFTTLTGYSSDEIIGKNSRILKTGFTPDEEYGLLWNNLQNKKEWSGEFCNKKKTGELYWEYAVISPVLNEEGVVTNYVAVKENITEQKMMQEDQRKLTTDLLKRNQELEKFSYILSHNIRGPLSNILGLKEALLRERMNSVDPLLLEAISDSADSMDRVIRDVTQILNKNKLSLEEKKTISFDYLLSVVKTDLDSFIKEKHATIDSDFSKAKGCFTLESYMQSIFYHLMVNALKFSKAEFSPKIQIWTELEKNTVIIHVKDYGIGIDLERYGKQVFGLYKRFNFNYEGRGVGLYLIKSEIDFLGGEIEIKSKLMEWTEFIIRMPL